MKRKDALRAALGARSQESQGELPAGNPAEPVETPAEAPRPLVRSGAVGAMGRSLGRIASAAAEARAMVASGDRVVELDPGLIEGSFVKDRLTGDPEEHAAFVAQIRERGQQVPILVRPHPDSPERYQVAYGRRRIQAARRLDRPVRAVVRPLSDAELVVAQGKENLERQDLSYIERAFFALRLEEHGFPRATITAAMGIGKGDLSTLISVARTVPAEIVRAIGPAPAAGRPRWMLLAERIRAARPDRIAGLIAEPGFREKPTNERFAALLTALAPAGAPRPAPEVWSDETGRGIARIERTPDRVALSFDDRAEPGLADYVLDRLPEIVAAYRTGRSRP